MVALGRSDLPSVVTRRSAPRAFLCRCGRPVFFRNSECLACHTPLGYDPRTGRLLPLVADEPLLWRSATAGPGRTRFRRCANLDTAAACNWLLPQARAKAASLNRLCLNCRLTRTVPDLSLENGALWWGRIEQAKRRLVSTLLALGLPVRPRSEDPQRGLAFDLLRAAPGGPSVTTGHADGVITLDVQEADDSWRESQRVELGERYRTLLGHLRHESGHYYWLRLVEGRAWHEEVRALFGDERDDYAQALQRHYAEGPPPDWGQHHVSAYASSHPWEDWAETWAHYLHMADTLDTARSYGLDGGQVVLEVERYGPAALGPLAADEPAAQAFCALVNSWIALTAVLNELSRSMGVADFYPFVLSDVAVRKLYLVHRIVADAATPRERQAC